MRSVVSVPSVRSTVIILALAMTIGGGQIGRAQSSALTGSAAVADAVLWGRPMPEAERTRDLPRGVQSALLEYRQREGVFPSALKLSPGATGDEKVLFERRTGIERTVYCLFGRSDAPRVAASYALDADIVIDWEELPSAPLQEAASIDGLLRDLPFPWLAPYFNLIAGHRKLCGEHVTEAERQLELARDGKQPIIRLVAEHLLKTKHCRD